jgi:SM-20-related protein
VTGEDRGEAAAAALAASQFCALRGFLSPGLVARLRAEALERLAAGAFRAAGIGSSGARRERADIRGDSVLWLEEPYSDAQREYLALLEELRLAINRRTFLGLLDFEGHFAAYPPGSFYRRHLDRFADDDRRVVSCIAYLNNAWRAEDGGALRAYASMEAREPSHEVLPEGGTLVVFLSDRVPHEVLPTARQRLSLTGWFRRRRG